MPILSALTNKDYMPYKTALQGTPLPALPKTDPGTDPCKPMEIKVVKNSDGRYIYANNPEMLQADDFNICNLRNENLFGKYFFTFENSMHGGFAAYAGYRLTNNGDKDLVVTVYNIGYQYEGEWLGAREWSDFYNLKFPRPDDYVDGNGQENWYYVGQDFLDYTPRVWEPETYRVPPGRYIWIFGGTTADNYNNINVAGTADILVPNKKCLNGVALFEIKQGENITGSLYFYTDVSKIDESKAQQGYITMRDGRKFYEQYKGIDTAMGLIETNASWTVNDKTPPGKLPVFYENQYDDTAATPREPYTMYNSVKHKIEGDVWQTALNPQNTHDAIGTDMSDFHCVDDAGNPVVVDCLRADGGGMPGNLGNWMIPYQDNFTFINTGSKTRTFSIYKQGAVSGALAVILRDRDGNVLKADLKCHPIIADKPREGIDENWYVFKDGLYWPIVDGEPYYKHIEKRSLMATVTVKPKSVEQLTVEYLILANSNGGIRNWVSVN
jgi:hypothetical protein